MKKPDFPPPGTHTAYDPVGEGNNHAAIGNICQTGPQIWQREDAGRRLRRNEPEPGQMKRQALDKLGELKSALLADLMQKVLPPWLRQRWTGMLMDIDFDNSQADASIDRLCRECNAARGMLLRVMPGQGPENRACADSHLVNLANGFNNLANQWWIYTSTAE